MQIHILGSCSGTEPWPGRDYTSWILEESGGDLLWFDAGGACASKAYVKGLSSLKAKALFLSHSHFDHTAGLPGIFQLIHKEKWLHQDRSFQELPCYTAEAAVITAAEMFLTANAGGNDDDWKFQPVVRTLSPGAIYRDDEVEIEALPNCHMRPDLRTGKPLSYSFRIQTPYGNIVYTGDVKSLAELTVWLEQPVALLMAETGHHHADALCAMILERQWPVHQVLFLHHGRAILENPAEEKAKADAVLGKSVILADDGQTICLNDFRNNG